MTGVIITLLAIAGFCMLIVTGETISKEQRPAPKCLTVICVSALTLATLLSIIVLFS